MGGVGEGRNKGRNIGHSPTALCRKGGGHGRGQGKDQHGTGPGIADDSLAPGQKELPQAPTDEEVDKMAGKLGAPRAEKDTLPLEGE